MDKVFTHNMNVGSIDCFICGLDLKTAMTIAQDIEPSVLWGMVLKENGLASGVSCSGYMLCEHGVNILNVDAVLYSLANVLLVQCPNVATMAAWLDWDKTTVARVFTNFLFMYAVFTDVNGFLDEW